jgi:hypothetical protein
MIARATAWFVVLLIVGVASRIPAASFVVTNLADAGPGTLRQAILQANTTPGDNSISITTNGTITLVTELPAITNNLVITGPGTNLLTISGSSQVRVFYLEAGTTNFISDLTIADGLAAGDTMSGNYTNASGIANTGSLKMQHCVVRNCRAQFSLGAGIYNSGSLELQDVTITACKGTYQFYEVRGGGIYNEGTTRIASSAILNCQGSANGPVGSGIYNTPNGQLFATKLRVESCFGFMPQSDGGAVVNYGYAEVNASLIANCRGYWAGGIESFGNLTMTNTTVRNCSADNGGGIMILSGTALLNGCTIASNRCSIIPGGAGLLNKGALTLLNCTLSLNTSSDTDLPGSAIVDNDFSTTVGSTLLNHCTIVSNSGTAEIYVKGALSAANSIIGSLQGTNNSGGYNLIVNTNDSVITGNTNGNIYNTDPLLGPLQDNGGQTFTHALLSGSSAIDKADAGGLAIDQRGFPRPATPLASDIGAFEVVPVYPPTLSINYSTRGSVVVSWASAPAGFVLQQNSVVNGIAWSDVTTAFTDDATNRWVVLPASGDNQFYRLRSP